jgi:aromatic-L-amino-acid decarboxylase
MIDDFVEQHRFLGAAVAQIINEHVAGLAARRVTPAATPAELEKLFDEPLPEKGIALEEILARFREDIAPNAMGVASPRYFGQFNPTPLPVGVWADALSSMLNQNAGAWRNGPTSAMLEARGVRWLCDLLNYGPQSFGTLASGGSEANLIALKCARDSVARDIKDRGVRRAPGELVIYASEQCHYSIDKSADILGLGREGLRKIPTDTRFHISLDALKEAIAADRKAGMLPCCIVGVAGTTSQALSIRSSRSPRSRVSMIAGITSMRLTVVHSRSRRGTKTCCAGLSWPIRSRSIRTSGCLFRLRVPRRSCAAADVFCGMRLI